MQSNDTDILLTSTLLRFYKASRAVEAHYKTASDFGIESPTVSSFLDSIEE